MRQRIRPPLIVREVRPAVRIVSIESLSREGKCAHPPAMGGSATRRQTTTSRSHKLRRLESLQLQLTQNPLHHPSLRQVLADYDVLRAKLAAKGARLTPSATPEHSSSINLHICACAGSLQLRATRDATASVRRASFLSCATSGRDCRRRRGFRGGIRSGSSRSSSS